MDSFSQIFTGGSNVSVGKGKVLTHKFPRGSRSMIAFGTSFLYNKVLTFLRRQRPSKNVSSGEAYFSSDPF